MVAGLVVLPWLAFNWVNTGNPLMSVEDSYSLNVKYRDYIQMPPDPMHFLIIGNYLIIFGALGMIATKKFRKADYMMIVILVIAIIQYLTIPIKVDRYLFNIILPLAYFSAIYLKNKIAPLKIVLINISLAAVIIILMSTGSISLGFTDYENYNISNECMVASNNWVPLNYNGITAEPPPRDWQVDRYIDEGYRIMIFKNEFFDDVYSNFIGKDLPIIEENEVYVIFGDESKCKEIINVDEPYIVRLKASLLENNIII